MGSELFLQVNEFLCRRNRFNHGHSLISKGSHDSPNRGSMEVSRPAYECFSLTKILNIFADSSHSMKYKRLLLKLSGEALMGKSKNTSIDHEILEQYSMEIKAVTDLGVELAIVIGG